MRNYYKSHITFILVACLLCSCKNSNPNQKNSSDFDTSFVANFKKQKIGNTHFSISLPLGYSLKERKGIPEDCTIFDFTPIDSSNSSMFTGSIYFGNFPSLFPPATDSCKVETIESYFLHKFREWKVYHCDKRISIQIISESNSGEGWDQMIHAFGDATSKSELEKLLKSFSTLKNQ